MASVFLSPESGVQIPVPLNVLYTNYVLHSVHDVYWRGTVVTSSSSKFGVTTQARAVYPVRRLLRQNIDT
jgi:hypothetical protein